MAKTRYYPCVTYRRPQHLQSHKVAPWQDLHSWLRKTACCSLGCDEHPPAASFRPSRIGTDIKRRKLQDLQSPQISRVLKVAAYILCRDLGLRFRLTSIKNSRARLKCAALIISRVAPNVRPPRYRFLMHPLRLSNTTQRSSRNFASL